MLTRTSDVRLHSEQSLLFRALKKENNSWTCELLNNIDLKTENGLFYRVTRKQNKHVVLCLGEWLKFKKSIKSVIGLLLDAVQYVDLGFNPLRKGLIQFQTFSVSEAKCLFIQAMEEIPLSAMFTESVPWWNRQNFHGYPINMKWASSWNSKTR